MPDNLGNATTWLFPVPYLNYIGGSYLNFLLKKLAPYIAQTCPFQTATGIQGRRSSPSYSVVEESLTRMPHRMQQAPVFGAQQVPNTLTRRLVLLE